MQVQPVLARVSTTIGSLPAAVTGVSKKPGGTWTTAAAQLTDIATQLGDEAAALTALTPPSALQPVQDAVIKGVQGAEAAVTKMAGALNKGVLTADTALSAIQAQIDSVTAQLSGLSTALTDAIGGLVGSPVASPAP